MNASCLFRNLVASKKLPLLMTQTFVSTFFFSFLMTISLRISMGNSFVIECFDDKKVLADLSYSKKLPFAKMRFLFDRRDSSQIVQSLILWEVRQTLKRENSLGQFNDKHTNPKCRAVTVAAHKGRMRGEWFEMKPNDSKWNRMKCRGLTVKIDIVFPF